MLLCGLVTTVKVGYKKRDQCNQIADPLMANYPEQSLNYREFRGSIPIMLPVQTKKNNVLKNPGEYAGVSMFLYVPVRQ